MKKKLRIIVALVVVLLTVGVFAYYLAHHTYLLHQLGNTPPLTIIILLLLYGLWLATLVLILAASLRVCRKALGIQENFLLNAYSTLINFFVPGQGGPIVRGAYLNRRHKLRVRDYIFVTLLYYVCYAIISAFMLLAASRPWWQTILGIIAVGCSSGLVVRWYARRSKARDDSFDVSLETITGLALATLAQAVVQVAIYAVELHSVNPHVTVWQAITYTGAANFALFVALTPGAIGIRESFLLFSEKLNHLTSANIVAASVLDRAVFIAFLGLLFVFAISFHAKDKLRIKSGKKFDNDKAASEGAES